MTTRIGVFWWGSPRFHTSALVCKNTLMTYANYDKSTQVLWIIFLRSYYVSTKHRGEPPIKNCPFCFCNSHRCLCTRLLRNRCFAGCFLLRRVVVLRQGKCNEFGQMESGVCNFEDTCISGRVTWQLSKLISILHVLEICLTGISGLKKLVSVQVVT